MAMVGEGMDTIGSKPSLSRATFIGPDMFGSTEQGGVSQILLVNTLLTTTVESPLPM